MIVGMLVCKWLDNRGGPPSAHLCWISGSSTHQQACCQWCLHNRIPHLCSTTFYSAPSSCITPIRFNSEKVELTAQTIRADSNKSCVHLRHRELGVYVLPPSQSACTVLFLCKSSNAMLGFRKTIALSFLSPNFIMEDAEAKPPPFPPNVLYQSR